MSVRTALGFQRIEVQGQPPRVSADFPLDATAPSMRLTPVTIRPSDVRLGNLLGSGFYGTAYRCTVLSVPLVVKVPRVVDAYETLPPSAPISERVRSDFAEELRNAERLLEPASYKGATFLSVNRARALYAEMQRMQAHPGYRHIHRLVHGEADPYPMLFSEPCDGTLWELRRSSSAPYWRTDTPEWRELARQLLSAFDYTRTRGLYHVDIKPDNIFFIGDRYMLADFGAMRTDEHDRSARQVISVLVECLGDNMRVEYTNTQPDPPFDVPFRNIAKRERITDSLMTLWGVLELRFEPYPRDIGAFLANVMARRPAWMPFKVSDDNAPIERSVKPQTTETDEPRKRGFDAPSEPTRRPRRPPSFL